MLIVNADLDGCRVDVRFNQRIEEVAAGLKPRPDEQVVDAQGGALLPGLHDHHMHFLATAAWANSVDCGGLLISDARSLRQLLQQQSGEGWLRGVNYHESVAGDLLRWQIDELIDQRPVRIQHRSGKVWMLNSAAVERINLQSFANQQGVEVDAQGLVTGRLFRLDDWLREQLASDLVTDVKALSDELSSYGITGFTDTSATNTDTTAALFADWRSQGILRQRALLMGGDQLRDGPLKIILDEDALPPLPDLIARLGRARAAGRSFAFHCVSHVELLYALSALDAVKTDHRDRIEHAAVVFDEALPMLRESGVSVVTQPGFLWQRGARYLQDINDREVNYLYRHAGIAAAGINVVVSSDAPYGPLNPWQVLHTATDRTTREGVIIGAGECVDVETALTGYLRHPQCLTQPPRRITVGVAADICVLKKPWREAVKNVLDVAVLATVCDGELIYQAADPRPTVGI